MINSVRKETLYYFFLRLFVYVNVFSESQLDTMPVVGELLFLLRNGLLVAFFLLLLIDDRGFRQNFVAIGGSILLFFAFRIVANNSGLTPITLFLIAWTSYKKDLSKIFKYVLTDIILGYLLVYGLCAVGILEDEVSNRTVVDFKGSFLSGDYARHNLGFVIHNQSPTTFLLVVLLAIGYRGSHLSFPICVGILALNTLFFYLCGSRVVFLLGIVVVLAYWLALFLKKRFHLTTLAKIGYLAFPLCCIGMFLATYLYPRGSYALYLANGLLNNRLLFGYTALQKYGFTLFGAGQSAGSYATMDVTVDSGYIITYLQQGLVVLVLMMLVFQRAMTVAIRRKNIFLVMALCFVAVENIVNAHIFSYKLIPFYCILLNPDAEFLSDGVAPRKWLTLE